MAYFLQVKGLSQGIEMLCAKQSLVIIILELIR